MKYRNTKRLGAILAFINLITLGLFFLFYMVRIRREIRKLGKSGGMPYPIAWLLGFITLWLVPLVWFANRAEELEQLHNEKGLEGKPVTFSFMFCWCAFGLFIIIGPFIAMHRFFATLNRLEAADNCVVTEEAKEEKPEEKKPAEAKPAEEKPEEKKEVKPVQESKKPAPVASEKAEEAKPEAKPEKPSDIRMPVIRYAPKSGIKEGKYWRIVIDGKYYYFKSQADAVAFARRIAIDRGVNITVLGENKTNRPAGGAA